MTEEQKQHYSNDKNHWCIVKQMGATPFYYTGYFGKNEGEEIMKPSLSMDFNEAVKLHSKIAAEMVLSGLKSCSGVKDFIVQDHKWI